ncbi:hypothetical protein BH23ACT4_BH23ACT4_16730 [soil metagenome]
MRKRAEQVEATKLRITEAAMRLHTTIGPSKTTISGVAEEAGVTRLTVYRHFPSEEELFLTCSSHWATLHPGPDPRRWLDTEDLADRVRQAISETYRFYAENHRDLHPILRDFEAMPPDFQQTMSTQLAEMGEALVKGTGIRGRRREALKAGGHLVLSFSTWRSLVLESRLDAYTAEDVAVGFVLSI